MLPNLTAKGSRSGTGEPPSTGRCIGGFVGPRNMRRTKGWEESNQEIDQVEKVAKGRVSSRSRLPKHAFPGM